MNCDRLVNETYKYSNANIYLSKDSLRKFFSTSLEKE